MSSEEASNDKSRHRRNGSGVHLAVARGERASANYRMVTSYWDTAASLVLNGGIDQKMFLDANTEHVFIYAKIESFLAEVRELFRDPDYLIHLENIVRSMPDFEAKMESRKRLLSIWNQSVAVA